MQKNSVSATQTEDELSEEELAAAVGGTDANTSGTILVYVNGQLTSQPASNSNFATITVTTLNPAQEAAYQQHIDAMLHPTIGGFGISSLFDTDDPTVKKVEGILVTVAATVVTAGAAGAVIGGGAVTGAAAGEFVADMAAAGIETTSDVTSAATGFLAGIISEGANAAPLLAAAAVSLGVAGVADPFIANNGAAGGALEQALLSSTGQGGSDVLAQVQSFGLVGGLAIAADPLITTLAHDNPQAALAVLTGDVHAMQTDPNFANSARTAAEAGFNTQVQNIQSEFAPMPWMNGLANFEENQMVNQLNNIPG